jgi:hypothetical protein
VDATHGIACIRPVKVVIEKVLCRYCLYQVCSSKRWSNGNTVYSTSVQCVVIVCEEPVNLRLVKFTDPVQQILFTTFVQV